VFIPTPPSPAPSQDQAPKSLKWEKFVMHFCSISNSSGLFLLRKCPHCLQESLLTPSDDILKMFVKVAQ
jgi:hypothetical protein